MTNTSEIREHMEVIASCGKHVGEVDHVEGNTIKMTKNDPAAGGKQYQRLELPGEKVSLCARAHRLRVPRRG